MSEVEQVKQWVSTLPSCAYDARRYLPPVTAVYFFVSGDDVLYVGAAACLRTRCKSHETIKRLADKRGLKVAFLPTVDYTETNVMEKAFVNLLRPQLNKHMYDYFVGLRPIALRIAGVKPGPKPGKKSRKGGAK